MTRVILIEPPKSSIDISKATVFGEISYVFDRNEKRCSAFDTIKYQREILRRLKKIEFDPDVDYICAAGSVLILSIGLITIAQRYSRFKTLLFSSTEGKYIERLFDINYVN